MRVTEPAEIAASLERSPKMPEGNEERLSGYGVMSAPFSSGELLAMRRFSASSFGKGYTTVWHRTKSGEWTIYTDRDPLQSCPRYFGLALSRAVETTIALSWPGPRRMKIEVPLAELTWTVDLEQTGTTRLLNAFGRRMSDEMWRSPRVLAMMSRMASFMLHAGRLGLSGRVPNGQTFVANPMNVWLIGASRASVEGRDLGDLAPLPEQARLGDFWLPQRALFAFGRAFFEPLDVRRHTLVSQAKPAAMRAPTAPTVGAH